MAVSVGLLFGTASSASAATPTALAPASSSWGFSVQIWSYDVADPMAINRQHFYNMCKPKKNVREFRYHTSWIYTEYECWAILA